MRLRDRVRRGFTPYVIGTVVVVAVWSLWAQALGPMPTVAQAQAPPDRFNIVSESKLAYGKWVIVVKDSVTGQCRALAQVYSNGIADLGEVQCH